MKLSTAALVIVLLFTTASAKPIGWPRHQDADIANNDLTQEWLEGNARVFFRSSDSSSASSSESSQSQESRESSDSSDSHSSEESSEEVFITDETTPAVTITAMTSVTPEDGSTPTLEPDTMSTDESSVTPPPATPPVVATSPGCDNGCFTAVIPTFPITDNRGDN